MIHELALWVRRCAGCDEPDRDAAFGSPALLEPGPWRCRRCGAPAWVAARLPFPCPAGRR